MTINNFTGLGVEAKAFYDRNLMERALPILGMYMAGQSRNLPKNGGNQVSFRRFESLNLATTPLTEGITPAGVSLSVTEITGTVKQYGNYITFSDAVDLMAVDPMVTEATDLLGENAGQSIEAIIRAELVTGTSVQYATGSARNAQTASNPLTLQMVQKAYRTLLANNAKPFYGSRGEQGMGGKFLGIIHPRAFYDLVRDTQVQNTFSYSDPQKLYTMELPDLAGVAWIVTTMAPVFTGAGSAGADVYGTLILGQNAFGVVDIGGTGKFETIVKPIGSGGADDPLNQRGTVGWKSYQLPLILNHNFMTRLEAGVSA